MSYQERIIEQALNDLREIKILLKEISSKLDKPKNDDDLLLEKIKSMGKLTEDSKSGTFIDEPEV